MNDAVSKSLFATINSLLVCLNEETHALQSGIRFDIAASNTHKNRLLFELSRASAHTSADENQLSALKIALQANALVVMGHVAAVRELSDLLISLMRSEMADGTYGRSGFGRRS